ncbi:Csu type fimbrial protein [Sphingosinicella xenopeptidilytica]|uniref:Spore coat U domain-containing protein n=1 Tax=Sphingosinicella xenopeptidilytica TaxID=364098 RepID=A0ABW3C0C8_SPHXN
MFNIRYCAKVSGILCFVSTASYADITGSIDATITLTTGCVVNAQSADDGSASVDFGEIDFGSHNTLFTQADGEVTGTGAGIAVQCSPGVSPVLVFNAGQNDGSGSGGGNRAMEHTVTAGQYVTYSLFSDAGRSTVIPIGGNIALATDGSAQVVPVYGRAYGATGLIAGTYTDVITVVLEL